MRAPGHAPCAAPNPHPHVPPNAPRAPYTPAPCPTRVLHIPHAPNLRAPCPCPPPSAPCARPRVRPMQQPVCAPHAHAFARAARAWVAGAWHRDGTEWRRYPPGGGGVLRVRENPNLQILAQQNPCHFLKTSEHMMRGWQKLRMRNSGRVVVPLRGPEQSPVLPSACYVGSLLSVGRCGRCSRWCRFRVRGAPSLVYRGCAECGGMCRLRVSGTQ